jgi:hypothetical protein
MTWAATSLSEARAVIQWRVQERMDVAMYPAVDLVRVPVAFIWVPAHLPRARETAAAYGYWDDQSAHYLDIVFFGWMSDGGIPYYDPEAYQQCVDEVRQASKWRPSGDIDLLLLNFELDTATRAGSFNFSEAIPLPIGQMIDEGKVANIQVFVQELINHARDERAADVSPVWQIHQRLALDRGRRSLWEWISRTYLKDFGKIYDDMRPYRVCNLART